MAQPVYKVVVFLSALIFSGICFSETECVQIYSSLDNYIKATGESEKNVYRYFPNDTKKDNSQEESIYMSLLNSSVIKVFEDSTCYASSYVGTVRAKITTKEDKVYRMMLSFIKEGGVWKLIEGQEIGEPEKW